MAKKEPAINFYQGHICIKDESGNLIFKDDSCIPILKEKIDVFIEKNPAIFATKDIIFSVITEHFQITKTFIVPNESSRVPNNDPLYNLLLKHILNNEIYKNRLETKKIYMTERKTAYDNYIKKNLPYADFKKDRIKYFSKRKR